MDPDTLIDLIQIGDEEKQTVAVFWQFLRISLHVKKF